MNRRRVIFDLLDIGHPPLAPEPMRCRPGIDIS
jgi:hypothetical protein